MTETKPDLGEFLKLSRPKRKPCPLGIASALLDDAEREQLIAACALDPGVITNAAIIQWLAGRGHGTSSSALTSHRRNTCTCHDS
jgi:hypothetical protein